MTDSAGPDFNCEVLEAVKAAARACGDLMTGTLELYLKVGGAGGRGWRQSALSAVRSIKLCSIISVCNAACMKSSMTCASVSDLVCMCGGVGTRLYECVCVCVCIRSAYRVLYFQYI